MKQQVLAKFKCESVNENEYNKQAKLRAVNSKEGDNADFTKYTPAGQLEITIAKEANAFVFFQPGEEYYLTFEKADK